MTHEALRVNCVRKNKHSNSGAQIGEHHGCENPELTNSGDFRTGDKFMLRSSTTLSYVSGLFPLYKLIP